MHFKPKKHVLGERFAPLLLQCAAGYAAPGAALHDRQGVVGRGRTPLLDRHAVQADAGSPARHALLYWLHLCWQPHFKVRCSGSRTKLSYSSDSTPACVLERIILANNLICHQTEDVSGSRLALHSANSLHLAFTCRMKKNPNTLLRHAS